MTPARQAALLPTARAGGCTPGEPPSCLRQGRGVAPQASRLLACGKGGGLHPRQAAFLPAARAGGCTPGEPPSCLRQGRGVAPQASRLLAYRKGGGVAPQASRPLACGKGGGLHPRQAALLPMARAEDPRQKRGENTRTRGSRSHSPSASERPHARNEILCQAFL